MEPEIVTSTPSPAAAAEPQSAVVAAIAKSKQKLRRQKKLAKKVQQYFDAKEAGRRAYAQADRLLDEVAGEIRAGRDIQLFDADGNPGEKARLVDQFAEKSIVWKPCGVRRYDLVMVK